VLGRMPTSQVVTLADGIRAGASGCHTVDISGRPHRRPAGGAAARPTWPRVLVASTARAEKKRQLLPAMAAENTLLVLAELTTGQVAEVMAAIPAAAPPRLLLTAAPAPEAARILPALPETTRVAVYRAHGAGPGRRSAHDAVRAAGNEFGQPDHDPGWPGLPWPTCDLTVGVLHGSVHVRGALSR